ncbi:MAG: DUF4388 domain-containing protein [Planctomycetota bacterium]
MAPKTEVLSDAEVDFLLTEASNEQSATAAEHQTVMMQGDLEQIQLADVMQTLATTKMEGTLRIRNPLEERQAYCKDGRIRVHVPQRVLSRRIGQRLISAGVVQVETVRSVLIDQRKDKRPLGVLLVAGGHCKQEHIDAVLEEQAAEDVYALFTWRHGSFELWKGTPQADASKLFDTCYEYDINSLLLEVARRSDEWETILAAIGSLDEVPQRLREPDADAGIDGFAAELIAAADGFTSYRELTERTTAGLFPSARAVRDLVTAGWLGNPDDEKLAAITQRLADSGDSKKALMTARTLVARPGDRSIEVLIVLAECLEGLGERRQASTLLLEAAQRQAEGETALDLARRARELDPHDVGTLSYLRTILLAYTPADSPELEKCTVELLDALTAEGRTDTALAIVEEARQTDTVRPAIMLREARARQKAKDIPGAVAVLQQLADLYDAQGERELANNAYAHLLRVDRSRRDIRKLLKERTLTRTGRIVRRCVVGAVACAVLGLAGWFWSHFATLRAMEAAQLEISSLIAKGDLDAASKRVEACAEELGERDGIVDLRTQIAYAKGQESARSQRLRQEELVAALAKAAEAMEQGKLAEGLAIYQRLVADADRRTNTLEAAERRVKAFTERLAEIAKGLQGLSLAPPEQMLDRNDLVKAQERLAAAVESRWLAAYQQLAKTASGSLHPDLVNAGVQKMLVDGEAQVRDAFRKAETLSVAYAAALQRKEEQRRLDPLFQRAVQREAANDFAGALADYVELERHSVDDAALRLHFRDRVARNGAIVRMLEQQGAATKAGDFTAALAHLKSLCATHPELGFERFVRLPLRIETRPAGARVRVNGADAGATPLLFERIVTLPTEVVVELAGFATVTEPVEGEEKAPLAFDLRLQRQAGWRHTSAIDTPPLATRHGIVMVDRAGAVTLLSPNRSALWTVRTDDLSGCLTRPVLAGDRVVFGSVDGDLRAIDLSTGGMAWSTQGLPMDLPPRPTADGLTCVTTSGTIVSLGEDGRITKRIEGGKQIVGFWHDDDGALVTLSGIGQLRRYAPTGALLFEQRLTDADVVGCAQSGRDVLLSTERGRVACIAMATGAAVWNVDLGGEPLGAPLVVGEHVWQTLRTGLAKLDRKTGDRAALSPTLAGEHVAAAVLFKNQFVVPTATGPVVHCATTGTPRYRLEGSRRTRLIPSPDELWLVEPDHAVAAYRNLW